MNQIVSKLDVVSFDTDCLQFQYVQTTDDFMAQFIESKDNKNSFERTLTINTDKAVKD